MEPTWYLRRLRAMSPVEIGVRARQAAARAAWRSRQVRPGAIDPLPVPASGRRAFRTPLPVTATSAVTTAARDALVARADRLLAGEWDVLGTVRVDLVAPDWFRDPVTGRASRPDEYAFDVAYRDEDTVGNVKQVWELSRHHHLTVLAAAFALTGDERYAERAAAHLRSWCAATPFLSGVHWTSGIELGIRMVSWVWTRRLLDGWAGAPGAFERDDAVARQVHHHCEWLARFPSTGSSANNHAVAEAAGLLVASTAFDWFEESAGWRCTSRARLATELARNTFPSGLNRELATEYHGLVLELGLAAALECDGAGAPLDRASWTQLARMTDALAAIVDAAGHPPRQGDADDGQVLVVDGSGWHRWRSLVATGERLFGRRDWWPAGAPDVRTPLWVALAPARVDVDARPATRPSYLPDAGLTLLRTRPGEGPEVWARCDAGPHGFLSIAAHAHADALSLELRVDGVEVLADPGTYCYHGEPLWRAYFRSTIGHSTLELGGVDQSVSGGPFLWTRVAQSRTRLVSAGADVDVALWEGEHRGYERLDPGAVHRRRVELHRAERRVVVEDAVSCEDEHPCRLAFHLGPAVECTLDGAVAQLAWDGPSGPRRACVQLPGSLCWSAVRGQESPPLGWYSTGFGQKVPATTLVGAGRTGRAAVLRTVLDFAPLDLPPLDTSGPGAERDP